MVSLTLPFSGCYLKNKVNGYNNEFIVQIKQSQGTPIGYTYTVKSHNICVEKCSYVRTKCNDKKTIYYQKVSKEVTDSIRFYLLENIAQIDTLYEVPMLSGGFWEVELSVPYSKNIRVENVYVPKIDGLFAKINRHIKKQYAKIPLTNFYK